jgi:hypothetical protein
MARRGTRKGKGKRGLFGRVYSPISHLLMASRNISRSLLKRSGRVVDNGLGAIDNVGKSLTRHANMTVRNVTRRRGRKNVRR